MECGSREKGKKMKRGEAKILRIKRWSERQAGG
jgi:hypothetical protein